MRAKKKAAGPKLVEPKTPFDESASGSEILPNEGKSQAQTSPPAVLAGDPDHSLVPVPAKRLLEPLEFFRFWKSIPARERQAWFIAYVYRKYPICDVLQPLSEDELRLIQRKQKKAPESNSGKVAEPLDPEKWERQVYEKWGAGDYQIRLNDTHPSVRGTICETQIRGLRDWDKFPPILNVEEVVLEEQLNQPYLRWARLHGITFPGDPGYENDGQTPEEENEMAVQASVEKLTDALIEVTSRPPQHAVPTIVAPPANDRSNEILADAALKGQQILLDSVKAQGKAQDPMEFHKAVVESAKAMVQPVAATTAPSLNDMVGLMNTLMAPILAVNQAMLEQVKAQLQAAERRAEALETRLYQQTAPAAPPAVAPEVANPVKNAIDLIKGLVSLKDQAGSLLGGDAGGADADMPVWARLASRALDAAPNLLYNAAVIRSGQGQPAPPEELSPALVEAEAAAQNGTAPLPEAKQEDGGVISKERIAREIAGPLIQSLNEGRKGFEFAAGMMSQPKIMGFPGRVVYEMAVEQGQDGMLQILQSYPELWAKLTLIPQRFGQFLVEFLDRDAAYRVLQEASKGNAAPPSPPSPPTAATAPAGDAAPQPRVVTPTVMPRSRVVVNPADGKPIHTAPVIDTTAS